MYDDCNHVGNCVFVNRLAKESAAYCSCDTKGGKLQFFGDKCQYSVAGEIVNFIDIERLSFTKLKLILRMTDVSDLRGYCYKDMLCDSSANPLDLGPKDGPERRLVTFQECCSKSSKQHPGRL